MAAIHSKTKPKKTSCALSTFDTEAKSLSLMKELTTTCISNILYLRKIFPKYYFESKNVEGLILKTLKSGNELIYQDILQKWLEGAFQAIDKKYNNKNMFQLKQLMLEIKDGDSQNVLEIYTIIFYYQNKNQSSDTFESKGITDNDFGQKKSGKFQTNRLLQMCNIVARNSTKLPSQVTLSIRLSYRENTPEDYQPPGYKAWKPSIPVFPKTTRSIQIGMTETRHHVFKLVNKSCFNDKFFKTLKRHTTDIESKKLKPLTLKNSSTDEATKFNYCLQEDETKGKKCPRYFGLRCPCLSEKKSELMFACFKCKHLSHMECFGVLPFKSKTNTIEFCCNLCHEKEKGFICHDKVMTNLKKPTDQTKLAMFRRVLKFIYTSELNKITRDKIRAEALSTCSDDLIQIIVRKMIEIGIASPLKRNILTLNRTELKKQLDIYFYKFSSCADSEAPNVHIILKKDLGKRMYEDVFEDSISQHHLSSKKSMAHGPCGEDESFLLESVDIFS